VLGGYGVPRTLPRDEDEEEEEERTRRFQTELEDRAKKKLPIGIPDHGCGVTGV
jgi:hypothetical protein